MNPDTNNKVARLRKAISEAINSVSAENGSDTPDFILADFLTDCLEAWNTAIKRRNDWYAPKALAPAPEESVSLHPAIKVIKEKMSPEKAEEVKKIRLLIGEDELEKIANTPEPAPEWREFTGTCELIQAGDEYTDPDDCWWPVSSSTVGFPASRFQSLARFRTRRPLPKQEERPLEKELKRIEWYQNYSEATIYHALADAIRYLRDEIEQLKKNQK